MLDLALSAAREAGEILLSYYAKGNIAVRRKIDGSPLTEADMVSHELLVSLLGAGSGLPVISEEAPSGIVVPPGPCWIVDPLDGTHEFIERTDEFTVNVALLDQGRPVIGVIVAPALGEVYAAEEGKGAFCDLGQGLEPLVPPVARELILVQSRHFSTPEADLFARKLGVRRSTAIGSALKFGRLARGEVTLYVRHAPSSEWDTAAGHCLIVQAGGGMLEMASGREPSYLKPGFLNPPFVAWAKGIDGKALLSK